MPSIWLHPRDGAAYSAVKDYIDARIWGGTAEAPDGTICAVAEGAEIIGAVIFNNFDPVGGTVELSAAADSARWLSRPVLFDVFSYAFDQLGCQAVVTRVDPGDTRLGRIFPAYGFQRYDIPRLRGRDKGEAIFLLTEEAWRANGFHKENAHG